MPKLQNAKHEAFANYVARGEPASRAYKKVYKGKMKIAITSGSRLRTNAKVKERIAELQSKVESKSVLTLQEKRDFLANLIRTPIGKINENSPLAQAAEYDIQTDKKGKVTRRTLKIKMPDKLRALELDAKLAGELRDDAHMTIKHTGSIEHKAIHVHLPAILATKRPAIDATRQPLQLNPKPEQKEKP